MDILSANKAMSGGGSGVIIHIIDTGVNPIPELAGARMNIDIREDKPDGSADV
jgi:hypothetical protein